MGETNEQKVLDEGKRAFCEQRFQDAAQLFRAVTKADPTNGKAWQFLGFSLNANQMPDEALPAFLKADQLLPDDVETQMGIALVYLAKGDLATAIKYFEITFKLDPDHHDLAKTLKGTLVQHVYQLLEIGNVEWAKAYVDRAYEIDKTCPEVIIARRDYYCKIDDHANAVAMIEELEEVKPDYPGLIQMKEDFGMLRQKTRGWLY